MVVLTGKDREEVVDILAGARATLYDLPDDPEPTIAFIDRKLSYLIFKLGGKKGVRRAVAQLVKWRPERDIPDEKT